MHFGKTDKSKLSNGCVRIGGNTLNTLSKYIGVGTDVYTLPDKNGSRFILKDGKLISSALESLAFIIKTDEVTTIAVKVIKVNNIAFLLTTSKHLLN